MSDDAVPKWVFTCHGCKQEFTSERTKEESFAEMREMFGDIPEEMCVTYCVACAEARPELDEMQPEAEA